MKRFESHLVYASLLLFCLAWSGFLPELSAQTSYVHPLADMRFTASPLWEEEMHQNNGQVFQAINPNRNLQVFLSYLPGCDHPKRQLQKLSGKRGLICHDSSYDTVVNGRHAWMLKGICLQGKRPYRRMITGIPGKEGLYIIEICCPEECYASHREEMEAILGSLMVGS